MRQNNHIFTRNNYQDMSSYKIRQPLNDNFYMNRSNQYQDYNSQENNLKLTKNITKQIPSSGYYLSHAKRINTCYDDRSQNHSLDLSYQSKGSNMSKNSIKMSDYVALQAKNLLSNKDKFKFDVQQNHVRSSSMQYYPKSSMKFNPKHLYSIEKNQQSQPYQIPSFGIQCRSTISSYEKPSTFIQHNTPSTSYYNYRQSQPYQLRNQKLKTQIDQRIQRLRTASNSVQHKQRMNAIRVLDANRIQNMDKINVKIKNILKTLQNEEDHYKRRFTTNNNHTDDKTTTSNNRLKTTIETNNNRYDNVDNNKRYDDRKYSMSRMITKDNRQSICSNSNNNNRQHLSQVNNNNYYYPQHRLSFNQIATKYNQNNYTKHSNPYLQQHQQQQQQSFHNNTNIQNYPDINVSSYYCYDDDQAMMKSSQQQSPIKLSSSQNNHKFTTYKQLQIDNPKKYEAHNKKAQYKLTYPQIRQKYQLKQSLQQQHQQQKQYQNLNNNKSNTTTTFTLNNIPQCQTQLIESKAIQNLNNYHIFDSNSQQLCQQQNNNKYHIVKQNEFKIHNNSNRNASVKEVDISNHYYKKRNEVYLKVNRQEQKSTKTNYYQQKSSKVQSSSSQFILPTSSYSLQFNNITTQANQPNKRKQNISSIYPTSSTNQPNYCYSDSIKQTPRIAERSNDRFHKDQLLNNRKNSYQKRTDIYSNHNDQLDNKLKNYQRRIQKYQKNMSASKILDTKRSKSQNKSQINLSNRSFINFDQKSISNNESLISQRKIDRLFSQTKDEKYLGKQCYQPESIKKSPRQSHRFAKQDHQKFIENLKREREQFAALSKRKTRQQNSRSVDFSGLSPLQRSNQRSESQNSRLSSVTIVKGKNVDAEIQKLQKKMQHYEQMKKQLHLQSQQNTNRSLTKNKQLSPREKRQSPLSLSKKYEFKQKSPRRQNSLKFELNNNSNLQPKNQNNFSISRMNQTQRRNQLLKIIAQQNCYVKVRKSIIKEHRNTEIKSYLNQELLKSSNLSMQSTINRQKTQNSAQKQKDSLKTSSIKENISPSGSRCVETQNYTKNLGQKKVIFGLAQNLNSTYQNQQQNPNMNQSKIKDQNDINTPKLLRNLKNKTNDKSIVMKKAQKRGFRSQFINDLHQDNELIYSAKKGHQQQHESIIQQTSRIRPQHKETFDFILNKFQQQIMLDEKFRNEKKVFNYLITKEKWVNLMNEYVKVTGKKIVSLEEITQIFTLKDQESNPFYSTRGNQSTQQSLIKCHLQCEQNWTSLITKLSTHSSDYLQQCGLSLKTIDIEKKSYINIEDLTRFLNMQMNKYYRKRDLYLLWKRVQSKSITHKHHQKSIQKLTIDQFLYGLGVQKTNNA